VEAHHLTGLLDIFLGNLGEVARGEGDYAAAADYGEQALDALGRDQCTRGVAVQFMNLGAARFELGELDASRSCFRETLARTRQLGDTFVSAMALDGLAAVAVEEGRFELAAALAGAAEAEYETRGVPLEPLEEAFRTRYVETLKGSLDPTALHRAWARGRSIGVEAAAAEALG
jgi:tetratricopeptide (TPR) repeat protein